MTRDEFLDAVQDAVGKYYTDAWGSDEVRAHVSAALDDYVCSHVEDCECEECRERPTYAHCVWRDDE